MIKLSKYLYIHWLFLVVCAFAYINRQLLDMAVCYSVITVHELSHLIAAKCLGLTPSHIVIYPFGLNLRLKNTMLYSISDEVILYMSGPLSNMIMSLLCLVFWEVNPLISKLYYVNLALMTVNLLPITPLDGGMTVKKLLNYRFGFDRGNSIMRVISFFILIILIVFSALLVYKNSFNPSVCIFTAFVLGNVILSKDKYNKSLMKELLYARDKKKTKGAYRAKVIGCGENESFLNVAKRFNQADNYFVFMTGKNNEVKKILSEEEIICSLLSDKAKNL